MGALQHRVHNQPQSRLAATVGLSATVHSFEISLNDTDRSVYEALEFRIARHPSETAEYLLTRALAYCLEYTEGLAFSSGGLSNPDAPALEIRDLTGQLRSWIEIGAPEPSRLHKAAKAAARVAVYSHRDITGLLERWSAERIHRADEIEIYAVDRALLAALAARLDRRMRFDLAVSGRELYISMGDSTYNGPVIPHRLTAP
jgi:uncharacterized protein YaeQ